MNSIVIDCGNSFIKGGLFEDGKLVKSIQKRSNYNDRENITDISAVRCLCDTVESILDKLIIGQKEILLGVCNEMHGFLLTDTKGNPETGYISWRYEFGQKTVNGRTPMEVLKDEKYVESIRKTGMPLRAGLPSTNLYWIYHSDIVYGKKYVFQTLGDFILWHMIGERGDCHLTNAAATGLYNIEEEKWCEELIDICCNAKVMFPEVGEKEIVFDYKGAKVYAYPAIGDQQAALKGSKFTKESEISINLGTGAQVSRIVKDRNRGNCQIRPYFDGKYIRTIPHIPSGRALNVYINFIKSIFTEFRYEMPDEKIWDYFKSVDLQENTSLDCDLSFFDNAVTTYNRGSISNISEKNFTIADLVRTVGNRFVSNIVSISGIVNEGLDVPDCLVFSGGVARNNPQIIKAIVNHMGGNLSYRVSSHDTLYGCFSYVTKKYRETHEGAWKEIKNEG